MANLVIDLANFKQSVSDRLPEGTYNVTIQDIEHGNSKAGDPMLTIWLNVSDGEYAGSTLVERMTLTSKAMFRVVAFMKALGLATPKKRVKVNTDAWLRRKLIVDVADGQPYRGRVNSEVQEYYKPKGQNSESEASDVTDVEDPWEDAHEASDASEPEPATESSEQDEEDGTTEDGSVDLDDIEL